jgi:hypothetical protein
MPSPVRAKTLTLLTVRRVETETPTAVVPTFRGAYKLALFELAIANPNLHEREARIQMRRRGRVELWDLDQFEHLENAMWSPVGRLAILQQVAVRKS